MRIGSQLPLVSPQAPDLKGSDVDELRRSARDFESLLLNSLWKEMQSEDQDDAEGGLGGGDNSPLKELAFQALSNQAAASGGLGLGRLILRSLGVSDLTTGKASSGVQYREALADKVSIHELDRKPVASSEYSGKRIDEHY